LDLIFKYLPEVLACQPTEKHKKRESIIRSPGITRNVKCVDNSFLCLLINLKSTVQTLKHFPQTEELPKLRAQFHTVEKYELNKRNQALEAQLRLAHIKEGEEIRFVQNI